jgi:hypothetical protein
MKNALCDALARDRAHVRHDAAGAGRGDPARVAGHPPRAAQVGLEHGVPALVVEIDVRLRARLHAGVVHQDVGETDARDDGIEEGPHTAEAPHVECHGVRLAAAAHDLRDAILERIGAPRAEHDPPARFGERAREMPADAARCTRQHDHLAVDPEIDHQASPLPGATRCTPTWRPPVPRPAVPVGPVRQIPRVVPRSGPPRTLDS